MTVSDRRTPVAVAPVVAGRARPRVAVGAVLPWRLAPLVALCAGVAAAIAPIPTLLVFAAALALALALYAPRTTAGLAVLGILFVRPLEHLSNPAVGYLDEALVLLCVLTMPLRRLIDRRPLRTFPGQWWFTAFLTIGLLSGLAMQVPPLISLSGAFLMGKGLLLAWAVAQLDWTEQHLLTAARVGTGVILFCLAATLGNLALPAGWEAVMASDTNAIEGRSDLPSLIGPFSHPIDLGQFMALSAIAITTWRAFVRKGPFTLGLLVATVAAAVLTARRTASGSLAAGWLWVQRKLRSTRVLVAIVACLPVAIVLLSGPITEIVQETYHDYIAKGAPEARTVLTIDSFAVAADHFPAGAGFGRFGSAVAAENYSPEYVARGYQNVWGLGRTKEDGRFLTDTEWPAIIGETGFLGAAAFAFGLIAIYRAGRRLAKESSLPAVRWAGLTLGGWLIALLVQSVATVTFTGPPVSGIFFGLVGVITAVTDQSTGRRPDRERRGSAAGP